MRGMPACLSWRWGTFSATMKTGFCPFIQLFLQRSGAVPEPNTHIHVYVVVLLCSTLREEHEEDITKRETTLVKKFFHGGIGNQTKKQKNKKGLAVRY